jgi:hypothetical protein
VKAKSGLLVTASLVLASLFISQPAARANVYATDIQVNSSLTNTTATNGVPVTISYRLNQTADLGVTVNILNGGSVVASVPGGTNMGLNTVSWTPTSAGTFGINITAAASGFPFWTQISIDTNAGMAAFDPQGIDVDKNTNSPYYGRVIMGCAKTGSGTGAQRDGFFKMNADGSQADEGWYGYGGYTNDDFGDTQIPGQMPDSSEGGSLSFNPLIVRIGDDDRIYWVDNSAIGAVLSCDILASTNNGYQVVIDEGTHTAYSPLFQLTAAGTLLGPCNYTNCPDVNDLFTGNGYGIRQFDVTAPSTSHGAVWLVDTYDSPNWGVWMFHLVNGVSDTNDTVGTKAIATGGVLAGTSAGVMVDSNLDIFVSQYISTSGATNARSMEFRRWHTGSLPPEAGRYSYAVSNEPAWNIGSNNASLLNINDTVIDSRANPRFVALPMSGVSAYNGIAVLNAGNGSFVGVTNGGNAQILTNLDYANQYTCAAWDGVGNLYGASTTANLWRAWSPPGANTNTTLAVAQIILIGPPSPPVITGITATPTGGGCALVTITFTAAGNPSSSAFQVVGSSTVNSGFAPVGGAVISGSGGTYQAVLTNCATQFFMIEE